jgi:hypothetical protein
LVVSTQVTPAPFGHFVSPGAHEHFPLLHVPYKHGLSHVPQSRSLSIRLVQCVRPPLAGVPGQRISPCAQWHVPLTHAPSGPHVVEQLPQNPGSLRLVHTPLQQTLPTGHRGLQVP